MSVHDLHLTYLTRERILTGPLTLPPSPSPRRRKPHSALATFIRLSILHSTLSAIVLP